MVHPMRSWHEDDRPCQGLRRPWGKGRRETVWPVAETQLKVCDFDADTGVTWPNDSRNETESDREVNTQVGLLWGRPLGRETGSHRRVSGWLPNDRRGWLYWSHAGRACWLAQVHPVEPCAKEEFAAGPEDAHQHPMSEAQSPPWLGAAQLGPLGLPSGSAQAPRCVCPSPCCPGLTVPVHVLVSHLCR